MATDPLAFLDAPETHSSRDEDPLSFLDKQKKRLPAPAQTAANLLIGGAQLAATPYELSVAPLASKGAQHGEYRKHIFEDIERLQEQKQAGLWDEQDQQLYEHLVKQIKNPEEAEKFVKTGDIGVGSLIEKGAGKLGVDLTSQDLGDELTRLAGGLLDPKKVASKLKDLPSLLSKEGRQAYKASQAAAKIPSQWESLRKGTKGNAEKQGIVNWAEQKGLTPREATLLLQSEKKIGSLGKFSKKTKQFERDVGGLYKKLGESYNELRSIGRAGGYLGSKQAIPLLNKLGKIRDEINLTHALGPESSAAKNVLSDAIKDIENNGTTIERLIATRQNLGQGVNWKKVGVKANLKGRMKDAITETIDKANPSVGRQLKEVDRAYAKYKKFQDVLDKKQAFTKVNGIPVPSGSVLFWGALGTKVLLGMNPMTAAKYYAIKESISRLSTAMLSNPKLQGVQKKLMEAFLSGNKEKQAKLLVLTKNILKKDDPELYAELGLED